MNKLSEMEKQLQKKILLSSVIPCDFCQSVFPPKIIKNNNNNKHNTENKLQTWQIHFKFVHKFYQLGNTYR